ncbi:unnamed protein product [Lactuca virosa]|uniref:CCHC-type domain-containing protein n=1 Tax=Lactuca virosa TaxID=75947 RepID=A0AAU9NZ55_9ASTR|nr:unnamed protein product [Lactuca virosa]
MQKLEHELWTLRMKGSDIASYTSRFEDLALLCPRMISPESKKIERFIWRLTQPTKGNVLAAKPDTFDIAKCLAQTLIDHGDDLEEVATIPEPAKGSGENKKKFWNKRKGQGSQGSSKKQQTVAVHAATTPVAAPTTQAPTSGYTGTLPWYDKCSYHHRTPGPCREKLCNNCGKKGHLARDCRNPVQQTTQASGAGVGRACYNCGEVGHFKRNCPKAATTNNTGRFLTMGQEEAVADPTVVTGTFLLDNSYACILFDSGAERSFVSHSFKRLLKHNPQPLTEKFTVEMANVSIKSFDVIIGMDWLSPNRADILCFEKAIPLNLSLDETLVIYGDKLSSNLRIISCVKAQKLLRKECYAFLAHVINEKQEVNDLESIPEVCNFPDVFPEDLPGIPLERQAEFRIDLVPGATPVAKSPYRLAPAEMQELSSQLNELLIKRIHQTEFLTLGSPNLVCEKEGWILSNVYRLSGAE